MLCSLYVIDTTLVAAYTRTYQQNPANAQICLLAEVLKLSASLVLYWISKPRGYAPLVPIKLPEVALHEQYPLQSSNGNVPSFTRAGALLHFSVPALCYFISNSISIYAISLLPAYCYLILMHLKIIATGLMNFVILGKQLSLRQQSSLVVLFVAVCLGSWTVRPQPKQSSHWRTPDILQGIVLMLIVALCSATGTVYTEWVMNHSTFSTESIHLQNTKLSMAGVLLSGVYLFLHHGHLAAVPSLFFAHMQPIHWAAVCGLAFMGLTGLAIIKFYGNLVKVYASALSIIAAALASKLLLGEPVPWPFYVGAAAAAVAVYMYASTPALLNRAPGANGKGKRNASVLLVALGAALVGIGLLCGIASGASTTGSITAQLLSTESNASTTFSRTEPSKLSIKVQNSSMFIPKLSSFPRDASLKIPAEWLPVETEGFRHVCPTLSCSMDASCLITNSSCCNYQNLQLLSFWVAFLHEKGLDDEYFGVFGTALGALRDGSIMPWTNDVDIAITAKAVKLLESPKVREELYQYGYYFFYHGIWRLAPHLKHPSPLIRAGFGAEPRYAGFPPDRV
jgi:drug/metabolite transporter (DMT)-like permease